MSQRTLPLLLVAPLLLAGCASTTGDDQARPMELSLEVDRDTIEPGQWTNATVTVRNTGDEPYTYKHPGCPPEPVKAWITGAQDRIDLYPYGQEPMFGACAIRNATFEPGQTFTVVLSWNGHVERAQPDPHQGAAVPPGQYELTVELARADGGPTYPHTATITVQE